ncbi:MAG: restriction endonuclease subunit S [Anaerolineae bacterium]|nr:restriction endonuclease subunit S [Anaerolineae bacterium]
MKQGWEEKRLDEVYDVRDGTHESPKFHSNGYPFLTSKNLKDGVLNFNKVQYISEEDYNEYNKRSKVDKGDVLFAMIGTLGNPVVVEVEPNFAIKNVALIKVPKNQSNYFLKYYLESQGVVDKIYRDARGTTQKFVGLGNLRKFKILLPPLSEQQRIVSLLDETFAALAQVHANAERNLVNAREVFEAVLEETFNKEGKDWGENNLGELCERITDGTHVTPKYVSEGVPFLSVKNLTKGFIDFSDTRFITPEEHQVLTKRVRPVRDDVLYTKVGTTGIAKVVDVDREFSIFVSIALLKIKHDVIFNRYLEYFLNSPFARKQAQKRTRGTANKNLVINDIKQIEIHYPKSLEEQRAIVQRLDALAGETRRLEAVYQSKLEGVDELRKSVLQKAFEGGL